MKKTQCLIAMFVICLCTMNNSKASNSGELSAKEKKALEAAWIIYETSQTAELSILLLHETVFNDKHEFVKQSYISYQKGVTDKSALTWFSFMKSDNNYISSVYIYKGECSGGQYVNFDWDGDNIKQVTYQGNSFSLEYDSKSRISKMITSGYDGVSGGGYAKSYYVISYDEKGHINHIEKQLDVQKGKKIKDLKFDFTCTAKEKTITCNDDNTNITFLVKGYKTKRAVKDPVIVQYELKGYFKVAGGSVIYENYQTDGVTVDERHEFVLNDKFYTTEYTRIVPSYKSKSVTKMEFDEKNWVTKSSKIEYTGEGDNYVMKSRFEFVYKYDKLKPGAKDLNSICSYIPDHHCLGYDANGNVISESTLYQSRHKNASGEWDPWKSINY